MKYGFVLFSSHLQGGKEGACVCCFSWLVRRGGRDKEKGKGVYLYRKAVFYHNGGGGYMPLEPVMAKKTRGKERRGRGISIMFSRSPGVGNLLRLTRRGGGGKGGPIGNSVRGEGALIILD